MCIEEQNCNNCGSEQSNYGTRYSDAANEIKGCSSNSIQCLPDPEDINASAQIGFKSEYTGHQLFWYYFEDLANGVEDPTPNDWWSSTGPKPERARLSFTATFATTPPITLEAPDDIWGFKLIPIPVEILKDFQFIHFGYLDFRMILSTDTEDDATISPPEFTLCALPWRLE